METFLVVVETRHFGRAAHALNVTDMLSRAVKDISII
ncbi:hypothetical protein [Paraburkholderia sp. GAS448]